MPSGGFSNLDEVKILNFYFTTTGATAPPSFWVALFTAQPNDDGTDFGPLEIAYTGAGGGYARQNILRNQWNDPVAGDPSFLSNNVVIEFDTCNADTALVATHWGLMLSQTGVTAADLLFTGTIMVPTSGLAILDGVKPQFAEGTLRPQLGSETLTP